jgi:hypothetical protein
MTVPSFPAGLLYNMHLHVLNRSLYILAYNARCGHFSAAAMLEQDAQLMGLCDIDTFRQVREVR